MRVYIAGALSSAEKTELTTVPRTPSKVVIDYIQNIHKMCLAARKVQKTGHVPYIPGLDFLAGVVTGDMDEFDYRLTSIAFLLLCEAVLVISLSVGVEKEIEIAQSVGIPIYYNVEDLPHA